MEQPNILREFGGVLELIEGWAGNVFKNMDWVKRKGTTGKVGPYAKFLEEENFLSQLAISKFVSEHDISIDLVHDISIDSASRSFLPIALIYNSKTNCSLPKYDFPNFFSVRFPLNHWSNFEKCVSLFEKIIFLYIQAKKKRA